VQQVQRAVAKRLAHEIGGGIANAEDMVVDTEYGEILTEVDFVRRMMEEPEWD
jgi:hypothetical protein